MKVSILKDPRVGFQDIQIGDIVTPYDVISWASEPFLKVVRVVDSEYLTLKGITMGVEHSGIYFWEVIKPTPHEIVLVKQNPCYFQDQGYDRV